MERMLVTGGTGALGRLLVPRLRAAGHEVRVLSRRPGAGPGLVTGDLTTGAGVDAAVDGVTTLVHCASARKGDATATANLVREASRAGTSHLLLPSIVGVERVSFGYTKTKLECERVVAGSGIPWTILRATQFYTLILGGVRALGRLPVVPVPAGFRLRPVDPDDVAARLASLASGPPGGRVRDLAGPQELTFADLVRGYLASTGRRRPVVALWLPGIDRIRAGALLPAGPYDTGARTWSDFVRSELAATAPA
jgi:uncharacterized protein YbjT (DUF2867 family)